MITANEVRACMNEAGSRREPFLFGVDFELSEGFFVLNPLGQQEILFEVGGVTNFSEREGMLGKVSGRRFSPNPVEYEVYQKKFAVVREGLARGDSFLLNLTMATKLEMDWTLEEIFHRARSPYRLLVPGRFVCFSPEIFVRIDEGMISSYPMKGTIDASLPNAERVILEDYKERSEHNTIVDLIRNDLNRVAEQVDVRRFRYIDRLQVSRGEILQVSSEVTGRLTGNYYSRLGEVIFGMLPAGSVSGAPKPSTLHIISCAEGGRRGFYTGVFGYFDGKRLDSAVMIRYIEECDGQYYFRSGGGITINSDCRAEYEEVLAKVYLPFGNGESK
ncbi:MAG TPA: aminodeoxychorismate synthase component I [Candidatus Butyricimonas faecavium]|nr:aminodeoxychorismate synthase component I [Candidatus Butyricimonas faecavium]